MESEKQIYPVQSPTEFKGEAVRSVANSRANVVLLKITD